MTLDRYLKAVLTVIAVALVAIALNPWLAGLSLSRADAQVPAKYELTIPKAWGKIIGYSNQNLLMEASDGTLRTVDIEGKAPEYPKIKAQVRWQ
jgi:hypothetical protein